MYLYSHSNLDAHTSQLFTEFVSKCGSDPKNFRGVSIDHLPFVEEIVERNMFIYNFDIQVGEYVGKSARQSIGKFEKTMKLLRFFNHSIHTNDNDSVFKCFGCPSYNCFFNRSDTFNRHLLTCKDRVRHIRPKKKYTLRVIKFETGFNIRYTEDQKMFSNAIVLDFESICVPTEELKATKTTNWNEKKVLFSISMSSNLQDDPIFLSEKELLIIALFPA